MAESRKVQVVLLDDRKLTFHVQAKMYTCDLFDIVASHFNLKEKEYFGLYYLDETSNQQWLQTDRKVLDHDLPRKSDPILLYFAVRFYIENMCYLQDSVSVELYYMQARQSVYRGAIECDSSTIFELAAYALQIFQANMSHDEQIREALKKVTVFPTSTLRDHPSIQYCEDQVLSRYYAMNGIMRGQAIISYMSIVEKLATYGVHYYEVKSKQGIPSWLGLSFKGIAQFDFNDKRTPRKVFPWKYLENLYFRDKKFSIEVHDPKRVVHTLSSFNLYEDAIREPVDECDDLSDAISDPTTQVSVSRRTFGPGNVNVYAWFTSKPQLTKCIWSMAVCQHQFFLDRLQNKSAMMVKRSPNVIADELSLPRTQSLQTMNHLNTQISLQESALNSLNMDTSHQRPTHRPALSSRTKADLTSEQKAKQIELYKGLDERKSRLETVLQDKIKELKDLCLQESTITGTLPHEYTLFMSPGERTPTIQRRMGTAFSIADLVTKKDSDLTKLEMEYEVQKQILKAKQKLATDRTLSKHIRKKHNTDYLDARLKLKDLEQRLKSVRTQAGLDAGSYTSEDNTSLGSLGSSPALGGRSPKKSASSQQLESLEYSPSTRRRMNSGSRLQMSHHKSNSARSFDIPSNPSSTSSLASLTQLEGCTEFTPTKALKYNRPVISSPHPTGIPVVHSAAALADLNSAGSSTANSSTSSLHAYSVSNGRPLRSGSMDDVRLAGSIGGGGSSAHLAHHGGQNSDRSLQNGTTSRSKNYLANNPYGSLERKALKQRRAGGRGVMESSPVPDPHIYNPYTPRANHGYGDSYQNRKHRAATLDNRHSEEAPPPIPSARVPTHQPQPSYRHNHHGHHQQGHHQQGHHQQGHHQQGHHQHHMDREYAQNVQQASRRMYDTSQPFQLLDNPYNTHRRNVEQLGHTMSDTHIAPISIDSVTSPAVTPRLPLPPRRSSSSVDHHTDSSSAQSSPQENAFSFFNSLAQMQSSAINNNHSYNKQGAAATIGVVAAADDLSSPQGSFTQEESKPYEMKDFFQYSEKLRKARGVNGASPRPPPDLPPQPAARSTGSRTPSSPAVSLEGSRSGSPYSAGYSGYGNGNQPMNPMHAYSHIQQAGLNGSNTLNARLNNQSRRSVHGAKDSSFNTGDVADNFSQEMLAWYQGQDPEQTSSTLV